VLNDISFNLKRGEMLGVIGLNGSGKTTLLRLLAKIMKPDKGEIIQNGKTMSFLELGTGFQPELTARDNIILYGMILGFTKKQIKEKMDAIVQYSELEKFIDTKLKNFSSGMYARLAFSTAIQTDPDIMLIDEILSVGDLPFQEKSYDTFLSFKKKQKSIVFISHNLNAVHQSCDRVLFLNKGKIQAIGEPSEVIEEYTKSVAHQ
jgi:lipopolysaccharide transport system ATP-binding protein